ncbi:DNA polymerase III subunit beta [Pseudalkalibacillus decolorationis]|uniref:DNA polymerase III subunit beta n=1 Tax=Pseudalkalibacillus decolorationis TaxID=163879 RepID=UPI0021474E1D|nr:DNA polymerase III subunit beta [Pseudalkalibacillus decolorationis]
MGEKTSAELTIKYRFQKGFVQMDFKIDKKYFLQAVSEVSKVIPGKALDLIHTGLKLVVNSNGVTLLGANGDLFLERFIPLTMGENEVVEVRSPGSIVIPAKHFHEIIKKLPNPISIKVDRQSVIIQSEEISTTLHSFHSEEFPIPPVFQPNKRVTITSNDLSEAIKQTIFATSKNESRPVLTGINLVIEEDRMTCVATNSHRLAKTVKRIEGDGRGSYIIPSSSLTELVKLMGSYSEDIAIYSTENYLIFKLSRITISSRLIAGNYPDVSGLIPTEYSTVVTLKTKQFLEGIDRACLFANDSKNNTIHLKIVDGSKLIISSNSTETGEISENQDLISITGENNLDLAFDGRFLMEALKTLKNEEVKLSFGGFMKPVLVEPVSDSTLLHLISPVRK